MTPISARASRRLLPRRRTAWRRVATAVLPAVVVAAATHGGTPDRAATTEYSSSRGGVSQMAAMRADG
jgi:hypothetical protein